MSVFSEVITSYVDLDHSIRFVWATGQETIRKSEIRSAELDNDSPTSIGIFVNLDRRVGKITLDTATLTSPDPSGSQATMLATFEADMEAAVFVSAGSVGTTELADKYKTVHALGNLTGAEDVDWDDGVVYTGTLTGNTTFTFSNLHIGVKTFDLTGSFTLAFPAGFVLMSGTYTGADDNHVQVECIDTSTPKGYIYINQEP